jgi:predicted extracellular nuclease
LLEIDELPANERYTYIYEGNAQAIDHILLSRGLKTLSHVADVVHVNSEFTTQASDHDPVVVRIDFKRWLYLPLILK